MHDQLVTRLLPILAKRSEDEFNIFNVMHHGTHEKQISNVFAWLLDTNGTHKLGDAFQRIFLGEVNDGRRDGEPSIPDDEYSVEREVNTSDFGQGGHRRSGSHRQRDEDRLSRGELLHFFRPRTQL